MKVQKITVFLLISLVACLPLVNAKNKIGLNEPFSIPSDPGATYKVLSVKKKGGKTEISSERQGKIYLSYVKREYDCNKNLVRYLAEGDTLEDLEKPNPSNWGAIVDGSIAYWMGQIACK